MAENRSRGVKQFRYEDMWQCHADYDQLVLESWKKGSGQQGLGGILKALNHMQSSLFAWGAREFGCLARKIRQLRARLNRLRSRSIGRGPTDEERVVVKQLREAIHQEEIFLRQRSRVLWLRAGDRNTKYFQAQAAQRKRMNKIESLERVDGSVCQTREENHAEVQEFFQSLYSSQGFRQMYDMLNLVTPRISIAMNEELDRPFTADEVRVALFQMASSKAPGVDGFTAGFFQWHWNLLKDDIVSAVLDFLNGGELPAGMNDTLITLIPKV